MKHHKCENDQTCQCGTLSADVEDSCPVHGGCFSIENHRCIHCGRFMKYKTETLCKRTLTIVVNIDDTDKAKWIWESHLNRNEINGVKVNTIVEGDEIRRLEYEIITANECD